MDFDSKRLTSPGDKTTPDSPPSMGPLDSDSGRPNTNDRELPLSDSSSRVAHPFKGLEIDAHLNARIENASHTATPLPCSAPAFVRATSLERFRNEIVRHPDVSSCWIIKSGVDNNNLCRAATVIAAMHGDEHGGLRAQETVLSSVSAGSTRISDGNLVLLCANEQGVKAGHRNGNEFNDDMNRLLRDGGITRDPYLQKRLREVKAIIQSASCVLDLHSVSADSPPFTVVNSENLNLGRSIGADFTLHFKQSRHMAFLQGTSLDYATRQGIPTVTFEAGLHDASATYENSLTGIGHFLHFCGSLPPDPLHIPGSFSEVAEVVMVHAKKLAEGVPEDSIKFTYSQRFSNFQRLEAGTVVATEVFREGPAEREVVYRAADDCVICLPSKFKEQNRDDYVFMLAKMVDYPTLS